MRYKNHLVKAGQQLRVMQMAGRHLISIFLFFSFLSPVSSQLPAAKEWEDLLTKHEKKEINDTVYLNRAQLLVERSFKDSALRGKLSNYKSIAWSKAMYRSYRIKYYAFLANNATFTHKEGAAIYYLQKLEEQAKEENSYINSLNEARLSMAIYGRHKSGNQRRAAIFEQVFPFIKTLPKRILKDNIPALTYTNAMTILVNGARLYAFKKDGGKVVAILSVAEDLVSSLRKKNVPDKGKIQQCQYLLYQVKYVASNLLNPADITKKMLDSTYLMLNVTDNKMNPVWRSMAEMEVLESYLSFFTFHKQADSAQYYLTLLKEKKKNHSVPGDGSSFNLQYGKLKALEGNYKTAYEIAMQAYEDNDSIIGEKTVDINNNMYAQLVAEQKSEALAVAEAQKRNQTMAGVTIAVILLIFIAGLLIYIKRKEATAAKKIEELNKITLVQINGLEAKAIMIQRKFGMDLHDDIAGSLVNVCNYIQTHSMDETDPVNQKRLREIWNMTNQVYQHVRHKSHDWYSEGFKEEEASFVESVRQITAYALPDKAYEKEISIDDASLERVSYNARIQLLYIIQEAVANILKHARASLVQLFIYEDENNLIMELKDNGKGFNTKTLKRGVGMQSMQSRVAEMNGTLEVFSTSVGTKLVVSMPL
ncbi:sensor histidine kinase [Niabella sp. CJ426]|uniref:sensor histidine kinase n=1 Tax=Niabella sp. CJ426 TaxID=3393740 RepID=UPI003CFE46BA